MFKVSTFSERLKKSIKNKNLTNRKTAELCDISESALCRYIKGERIPNADILYRMSAVLGVTSDYLIGK